MFSPSEIMRFAVNIERNGEEFYRYAMTLTQDEELRATFDLLAREEVKHERLFSQLLSRIEGRELPEHFTDEYVDYLRAYVDQIVFSEQAMAELERSITTDREALRFAMGKEQDTILFYMEIREMLAPDDRRHVDQVISEERKHYLMLAKLIEAQDKNAAS